MHYPGTSNKPLWFTAVVLLLIPVIFHETAYSMVEIWWRSETFAHGFLILPISAYMIWVRRDEHLRVGLRSTFKPLALFVLVLCIWFVATVVQVNAAAQFAIVAMIPLSIWMLLGHKLALSILFPLLYLFFAVPFGDFLVPIMIDQTARFTIKAVEMTGIPVYADGRMISLPTGSWEVAAACSGIRYLMASVAIGSLFAYLSFQSYWKRAGFILLSILIPILANWLRAFGIVMIGHFSNMTLAVGVDHIVYGWVLFGIIMLILLWLGSKWSEPLPEAEPAVRADSWFSVPLAVTILLLGLLAVFAQHSLDYQDSDAQTRQVAIPDNLPGWRGPLRNREPWEPRFEGASQVENVIYEKAGRRVYLYAITYAANHAGKGMVSSSRRLFKYKRWLLTAESEKMVTFNDEVTIPVREDKYLGTTGDSRLAWRWYDIGGQQTGSDWRAKLNSVLARINGVYDGERQIAVATDLELSIEDAEAVLKDFILSSRIYQ